ncbi:phthiocerol synthesis polyketide synthase type I PpsA [Streptomyces lucensis JCM 4490]|uniref:Phthiocerol synthesis polyketide synthase type I PpsA n=1 Tax=Streptomyces lucensis JCM 4490 TaxID=1306176 RepID=A0A918MRS6_9ACTN|nr:type I polyketide synthase [Streptomyces lucensis]GGW54704.1 phthiocerol synthesis polyketide synthase type I PpsA [Streptomyces lucensis JCM 4490]
MPSHDAARAGSPDAVEEPIAVLGMACRFAGGADTPEAFWDLLLDGRDGIGEVPGKRWRVYEEAGPDHAAALRRATRWGGFLDDIEGFDAEFFGLSPREAELMDPQQRLLLEVAWEALEHAGIPPRDLAGTDAGVFVGIGSDDYGRRMLEDLPGIEAWTGIGSAMCAAANRISYALDLRGPSLAVDTACSASLVAVHLACQSLRAGESDVTLAAGVNLIISPGLTLTLDAAGATAPDGRSKSFDASADGYGRGEGCGLLVLKRLSDARRDGDPVLAVIRGSSVNQDGKTNGIMAPSGTAQEHVLELACRRAGVDPASLDYVEAHGTGTRLGDPLEAGALSAVFGRGRPADEPCLIGSVKSNIGHLEAAAGIAGLIKVTLALSNGEIPPSLNFTEGNPAVDWDGSGLRVVTGRTAWPAHEDRPVRAGVSGFGYGGTIAHVVMERAPGTRGPAGTLPGRARRAEDAPPGTAERLFPVSGASRASLRAYAGRLADRLSAQDAGAELSLDALGHTLALRRSPLAHRAAVVASGHADLAAKLRLVSVGEQTREAVTGSVPSDPGAGPVWVFSGHGSQWSGMGRELLASEPAFAAVIDEIDPVFQKEIGFSARQAVLDGDFDTVDRIQTMIFAVQVALAAVWRSYGAAPAAVIGHSVGEIAAAVAADALSLTDGARLICRRSRLLRRVAGHGAMAMASVSFEEAERRLAGRTDVVPAIAASPHSAVVAGDPAAIEALVEQWQAEDVQMRRVASDVAFHSPHMDPLLAELAAAAADLAPREPSVPMYSTAMTDPRSTAPLDGAYWAANLRSPVRLREAVTAAAEDGHLAFLELSAHPVVTHSIGETLSELGLEDAFTGSSLRRNQSERTTLLASIGAAHCHGVTVDWTRLQPAGDLVPLPPVAWQRSPHWHERAGAATGQGLQHDLDSHALLGPRVPVAGRPMELWRTLLDDESRPYPGSHTINGTEIVPAAVLINTFLDAGRAADGTRPVLRDMTLRLPLTTTERRELQVIKDDTALRLASRSQQDGATWLTHTTATALAASDSAPPRGLPPGTALDAADPADVQRHLTSVGVPTMGFDWTIEELARAEGRVRARVRVRQPERAEATWAPLLDAALSIAPTAVPGPAALRMVASFEELAADGAPPDGPSTVEVVADPAREGIVDVLVKDADGRVVAWVSGLRYGGMDQGAMTAAHPRDLVYEVAWRPLELPAPADAPARRLVLVAEDTRDTRNLSAALSDAGADVLVVPEPARLDGVAGLDEGTDVVVLPPPAGDTPVAEAAVRSAWLLTRTAQRLAARDTLRFPRLWCLTTGVRESHEEARLAHAPLWGLGRVIAGEHSELWGGVIDLAPGDPGADAATLLAVLHRGAGDDVVAVRDGAATAARLAVCEREPVRESLKCRADGTYLISGGLGTLGLEVARWLAERGARRLVLTGRRGLPPRSAWDGPADADTRRRVDAVRALEEQGVTVRVVPLDVTDAERAAEQLDPDALGLPPVRGVVHLAGVLDNRMLTAVDEDSLRTVLRPKAEGAWALHTLFPPGAVDFFVMFSSCGQLLGLPGQAAYGSANAFLDALAAHRNARAASAGTTSLGWTSWRGQGMAVNEVVDSELHARGVSDISVQEAFAAWDFAERRGPGHYPVLRLLPLEPDMDRLPFLSEVHQTLQAAPTTGQGTDAFTGLSPDELRTRLLEEVAAQIAGEMKLATTQLDHRRSLVEQGLDSVMTIVVRRRLEKRFGHRLPATLLWHQPTVTAISEHLAGLLAAATTVPGDAEPAEEPGTVTAV